MNPYQKMKQNSYESMSQGELLLALYDGAIKDLKRAEFALEDKEYDLFYTYIDKTGAIIRYLIKTLDLTQTNIAWDLKRLYEYIIFDLSMLKAGRERKKKEIPELITILSDLREGFDGASKQFSDVPRPEVTRIVG